VGNNPRLSQLTFTMIVTLIIATEPQTTTTLMSQAMIEAGAAGVHFEDQLSSEKKCGHLGGACLDTLAAA